MNLGFGELVVIFLIVLVVFGAGRIPKIGRDIGSGIREFKRAMSGDFDDEETGPSDKKEKSARKR